MTGVWLITSAQYDRASSVDRRMRSWVRQVRISSCAAQPGAQPEAVADADREGEKGTPVIENWRKATQSANDASCVETGWANGVVGYRDTKQAALPEADRPTLTFSNSAARAFLAMVTAANR
jgi:hypothetical protein